MIFLISILVIFLIASVYFFFRAESLQKRLLIEKKKTKQAEKDNQGFVDTMLMSSSKYQDFAVYRVKTIQDSANKLSQMPEKLADDLNVSKLFFENYGKIFIDAMTGKTGPKRSCQESLIQVNKETYRLFIEMTNRQDKTIRRMWNSDNLAGFVSFSEALLLNLEKQVNDAENNQLKEAKAS